MSKVVTHDFIGHDTIRGVTLYIMVYQQRDKEYTSILILSFIVISLLSLFNEIKAISTYLHPISQNNVLSNHSLPLYPLPHITTYIKTS